MSCGTGKHIPSITEAGCSSLEHYDHKKKKYIILHTTVTYYGIGDVGESSDKQVSPTFRPRTQIQS